MLRYQSPILPHTVITSTQSPLQWYVYPLAIESRLMIVRARVLEEGLKLHCIEVPAVTELRQVRQ